MPALAWALIMFEANTTPTARLSAPVNTTTDAVDLFDTSALISASSSARTSTAPPAWTLELWM